MRKDEIMTPEERVSKLDKNILNYGSIAEVESLVATAIRDAEIDALEWVGKMIAEESECPGDLCMQGEDCTCHVNDALVDLIRIEIKRRKE